MQEIIQFLNEAKVFYLATAEGDQPRVRPMGFVMEYEGKLCFCTNNKKEMYKQMKANPKIEISACGNEGKTLRIAGSVAFNTSREAKVKALEVNPHLKTMYSPDDGIFEVFYFIQGTAVFGDMKGGKKEVKL
ncbi:pyridoxamine 5'-phosphate oxidase family protein [Leadbettera azotonutricia]|uniref:NimC/NimA family protein n=1 Tax=Leadbettera azotonutricia (strain ATCC BAA-888 / DSM 13862 / ZAS-9) TaxID=545695 RepID=F5Y796_LEAAZ|nr:pyridoxamine 5'-phosphate oxidase family protein [Leadbettera azotonutricia]AEF81603.1 NimC/NimA family protein [Leadbettera azotonutricia ZAS-9]